jgi:hypothetical protein
MIIYTLYFKKLTPNVPAVTDVWGGTKHHKGALARL